MEDYNKIIESLNVKLVKGKHIRILQSATVSNHYDTDNYVFLLHDGAISFGKEETTLEKGDILFVPSGKLTRIAFGLQPTKVIDNEEYITHRERYFEVVNDVEAVGRLENSFSYIGFEAKVFDSISFFNSLDIPPFVISGQHGLARMIRDVIVENINDTAGKNRVLRNKTEQVAIEIIRYILRENMFVEQLATNSTYFKDPRLIDIFNYIREQLGGDLSNKTLANVANVSEDYVGQYFKMLTGINPQDYIEYQRMEHAVMLLRTSKKSIREIGSEVGYKDTAYFCRRFKMMFGIPAGKMRRRDTMMSA
ncbi:MAG: AraC family transcriptional regulator [Bacteroidetes bacterium]|nr:MAG: AraC family transcriptional regulator [Bacteroidota bacterium]